MDYVLRENSAGAHSSVSNQRLVWVLLESSESDVTSGFNLEIVSELCVTVSLTGLVCSYVRRAEEHVTTEPRAPVTPGLCLLSLDGRRGN